jgi:hypothetical protein
MQRRIGDGCIESRYKTCSIADELVEVSRCDSHILKYSFRLSKAFDSLGMGKTHS